MDSSFTTSDGARIHYRLCGSGFPIVFLHGNNLSMDYFFESIGVGRTLSIATH